METSISVEEAIKIVLQHCQSLPQTAFYPFNADLVGKVLAKYYNNSIDKHFLLVYFTISCRDIIAKDSFPPFPASIMDGYAVHAPLQPGIYKIQENILAGNVPGLPLQEGFVSYITTGAMLPEGSNAVVKIEDTEKEGDAVRIKKSVAVGTDIRGVGTDIRAGETVVSVRSVLGPSDVALIATAITTDTSTTSEGVVEVLCYRQPVVGVLSTGSELVDPWWD
jgi:molybdopterin biosynthesis enzyme